MMLWARNLDLMLAGIQNGDPDGLNEIAWVMLEGDDNADKDIADEKGLFPLALQIAQHADQARKGDSWEIADTLALACYRTKDFAKAIETQQRALKLSEANGGDAGDELRGRLAKYKEAAKPR